jgi:hypothetical protein
MKDCTDCIYADWQRTESGRLHPSGDGKCQKIIVIPKLPPCWHWAGCSPPSLCGGHINRRQPLSEHCQFYQERIVRPSDRRE